MIQLEGVTKRFNTNHTTLPAVSDLNLTINQSEIFGLIGQSGAGKSTVLRFINGLLQPDEGQVMVDGNRINQLSEASLRKVRKDIAMVFQQFNLLDNLTVEENILLPLKLHTFDNPLTIVQVLEAVGLSDKRHHYPSQLSGGQKQRVGIARALIINPKIILLDEPTSALDEMTAQEIVRILKEINQLYAITMVLVTHQLSIMKSICQRIGIMEKGRLIEIIENQPNNEVSPHSNYSQYVTEVLADG